MLVLPLHQLDPLRQDPSRRLSAIHARRSPKVLSSCKSCEDLRSIFLSSQPIRSVDHPDPVRSESVVTRTIIESDLSLPLILVTGATGYIGSHVVLEILRTKKFGVIAIDNLSNSGQTSLDRIRRILVDEDRGSGMIPELIFHKLDLRHQRSLDRVIELYANEDGSSRIDHVIHFAGLKSVMRSKSDPRAYYENNVIGTEVLLRSMELHRIRSLVFSSSAVVYGLQNKKILNESDCELGQSVRNYDRITSPYGYTKLRCEEIIHSYVQRIDGFKAVILRYSNPSGNDPSGWIGDCPTQPENLMPIVCQVLQDKRDHVKVFGHDYQTRDGTGVRDFIHVQDLAKGHLAALDSFLSIKADESESNGLNSQGKVENCRIYNLSTGRGATVKEIIRALETVSGSKIKSVLTSRRPGDLDIVICDPTKAYKELGWRAEKSILDMARDMWTYCLKNPDGLV